MNNRGLAACALLGITLVGCGDGDPGAGGPAAACVPNKVTLAGTLDGQIVSVQIDLTALYVQQGLVPYTLDVGYDGGTLYLEWNTLIPINGSAAAATGSAVMPAGAPHAGEPLRASSGSIKETDPDSDPFTVNYVFTLGTLSLGPTLPGAPVAGAIDGCIGG